MCKADHTEAPGYAGFAESRFMTWNFNHALLFQGISEGFMHIKFKLRIY